MNRIDDNSLKKIASLKKTANNYIKDLFDDNIPQIYVGMATCGRAAGALDTKNVIEETLSERNIEANVTKVGCIGHCYAEPIVIVSNPGFPPICYFEVTPGKAKLLVKSFIEKGDPLFEYILGAMEVNDMIPSVMDLPRFNLEERIVMDLCGRIDPENIYHYIANDGYNSLAKALTMKPEIIINKIKESGLRGRGGAGFSTGMKWEIAKKSPGNDKIVICNADEGDPGAYMDRTILESNPHQLLEGLIICAYAVGASKAIIYIRSEYPLAVDIIQKAIDQAVELNLSGKGILNTSFDLDISVFHGSGAFVCGEETALIQSIEGRRGMPQHRPPYPVQIGLWGMPTVINNVKSLSYIPQIVRDGVDNFKKIGTTNSSGTAIFSIVGNVLHAGLVEVPMGTSIRSLIFDTCGGIPDKKSFKAVQIGGPSGGCLPESFLDTEIDFDSLVDAGAMMGSGGMVVMDENSCMVDVSKYFLEFTQNESCGKCTFCRIGTKHLLNILDRLTKGEGREGDLELLETLAEDIKNGSQCGLGRTAPNPILTSLKYFRDEYDAHLKERRCPAKKCRTLTAFYIDLEKCARGCDACVGSCPVEAIFTTKGRKKGIDQILCVKCGECVTACPPEYDAVKKISPTELVPIVERIEETKSKDEK
ncbi:MAG: NADH-ubiquinone oxidoreductase-F iron-sulfur binding region domain-containing protein [Spirochaetota bacterium]|nr:NADH-ubiquinone oxidoreductase-F iron-sulfur binding region domain-containing protein [Spirochaetota bacterium]